VSVFCTHEHEGANIMPNSPTLPHRTTCTLCGSIEKNADSLVKGMTLSLCAQVGGGGEGEKGHGKNRSPPSVRGPLVFLLLLR